MKIPFFVIAVNFLQICAVFAIEEDPYDCDDVRIIRRKEWRARNEMRSREYHLPVNHVIILHTVTAFCKSRLQCVRAVQFIQDMHLDDRGWWDIAYNFLVGGEGSVYEGRGWFHTGSHAVNYNTNSLGIAFIGSFNRDRPTVGMVNATKALLRCGVRKGYLSPNTEIHGHRDVACTESPGDNLYAQIRYWDNYKGGRLPNYYCKKLPIPQTNRDIVKE